MPEYEAVTGMAEELLAAQMRSLGRLPGQHTAEEYVAALEVAQAEALAAGPAVELAPTPPRDVVAGVLVHGKIEQALAVDGRRLEDLDPNEYMTAYLAAEAQVYGGVR